MSALTTALTIVITQRDRHAIVEACLAEVCAYHRAAWVREAKRIVAELCAWAKRDRDGWDVARARSGQRAPSGRCLVREAAARAKGAARSAATRKGVARSSW